ncbi:MAG: hypothetical protein JGK17_14365 [Microcoleus sp. PH2017_10_PVI_O_A]|uniref:hypothetical protein n=1 Tax=unclassified Microcoleus TaxID=2642155 RepID=UPI001D6201AA|nr:MULTISPECIES: hypothetical protein [unclassified Microcoleus]TAE82020.1 MAG: hypothetical protein EAZ83_14000 [Oscillatoriales cyanobacterium]MCC3406746.1 hypothetical protein [Microcoleus sp. PH2017_10_PVI_O_A]MCC3460742.1 hypothetical protein [Microcoleus sp. PH2017_11_PCY_U_A]MCC3479305.1 hypothetical protein [Microcoleus sp. PH2017_12_PCY_D_A]MCC3560145.1 hypothetical protein [Microcoleus sp. PH2017_27_LUM_O_A]
MICHKFQHFKVDLLPSDRTPESAKPIAKTTRSPKTSAAGIAIGTLLILLAPPVQAANVTFVSDCQSLLLFRRADNEGRGPTTYL